MSQKRLSRTRRTAVVASGAVAAAVMAAVAVAVPGHSAPASTVAASADGFSTVWSDDFDGTKGTSPSSDNWLFDIGHSYPGGADGWGTGEIEEMTDSTANAGLDGNGNLNITPVRDASGHWTSSRIETQRTNFAAPEGGVVRFESRIQLPDVIGDEAQGIWPAFWSLGEDFRGTYNNWPGIGEVDVMENVNGQNTVYGTLHCGTAPGGVCNESTGRGGSRTGFSTRLQSGFHTYAVELDRSGETEELRWYVDGEQYHTVTEAEVGADVWEKATDHGFFLILNVAVGGGWPGSPTTATASGRPMTVDYVKVLQKGGDTSGSDEETQAPEPSGTATTEPAENPTTEPVTSEGSGEGDRDAFHTIQAESFDSQTGIKTVATQDGGKKLGSIANGDLAVYKGIDFGDDTAHTFVAKVASGADNGVSGLIQVRLDSPSAEPVAQISVANTGGWEKYKAVPGELAKTTGTHDVYLTFTSGSTQEFVDVDAFTFSR
ncbi:glycoside hydrolase family 16 protein [Kineosporia mesophila]|uniref:Glycoside hydrolase family 16 protein n=1 Tax=Kineosporia mesophila TaxID=566012 RepID=A0ABP6ZHI6_9ACTN|nr:carbohydrate-binding protein [Kineosporia mesophila]MCD5350630.1 carbohydrate-binding protein [Kineosporia mesophila]